MLSHLPIHYFVAGDICMYTVLFCSVVGTLVQIAFDFLCLICSHCL